jgi:hypothetical protein
MWPISNTFVSKLGNLNKNYLVNNSQIVQTKQYVDISAVQVLPNLPTISIQALARVLQPYPRSCAPQDPVDQA